MKKTLGYRLNIVAFLLPALFLFVGVLIAPIVMSVYYSFTDWNGYTANFVGISNYIKIFTDPMVHFPETILHSFLLAFFSVFIQLPFALWLALKLSKGIKGERFFISVFFMPVLISTVVIGQLWLKIYNPDYGVLNVALRALGLESWTKAWLGDKSTALVAAFIPTLWQYVGYHMLLMYAGIKGVPPELLEAGMLDGCTEGQLNRHIVIPYIKPILRVSVIFAVTGSLKSYDLIYVLTKGGPGHATDVPARLMVNYLFDRSRPGIGCAIAVILIVLCFAFALLINVAFKEEKN